MKKNLKLFVWEKVLCGNTDGMMVALAETEKEAQDLIIKKAIKDEAHDSPPTSALLGFLKKQKVSFEEYKKRGEYSIKEDFEREFKDTKPQIIIRPEGFYCEGGG